MAEVVERSGGVGSSLIWAVALIVIVGILAAVVFYSGILSRTKKSEIDINVKPPAASH
jgi:hypothetical protein